MIFRSRHTRRRDAELVTFVADGDERAFGEFLQRHQDAVYGFAHRMLNDAQEVEDVTQEAFLRLFRASTRYRPQASLRTYLLRITRNICIDIYRKKRPELLERIPDMPVEETPLALLEETIGSDRLGKAITGLPVNQRTALLLRHTQQLSCQPHRRGHGSFRGSRGIPAGARPPYLV
jgi:RNA polymerase sigma-70 factor (ECF subfamily)